MKAEFSIAEKIRFEEENRVREVKLFQKNINVDGMINYSGQGERFAVVKATDVEGPPKTFGRIQIRNADEVRT